MNNFKVLFHVNESNKWNMVLANINNAIKDLGQDNVTVEVVANGEAVVDYACNKDINENINNELINKMLNLSKLGVKFAACKNSLAGNEIDEQLLPNFITIVPAGISELIKCQAEGFAYIKP